MVDRITCVGLDVHKEGIVVAVAAGGLRGEVREYGRREYADGAGPIAAQARRRRHELAVSLRSRAVRLRRLYARRQWGLRRCLRWAEAMTTGRVGGSC
jgi:hypothetical protein